jgi:hypothetical protein
MSDLSTSHRVILPAHCRPRFVGLKTLFSTGGSATAAQPSTFPTFHEVV